MTDGEFTSITCDLGTFRNAAAGYVKFLIRARWKSDPGFLSENDLRRWKLLDIHNDTRSASQLLLRAGALLGELNTSFINRCGSGGVAEYDLSTPAGRLMNNIAFLAEIDGDGPHHNRALISQALRSPEHDAIDWASLVDWSKLPEIRDDLDRLPNVSPNPETSPSDRVAENTFRRVGADWNIRFRNGRLFAIKNGAGPTYLHHLLSRPNTQVEVHELSRVWDRFQATDTRGIDQEEDLPMEQSKMDLIADDEALAAYRKEYDEIQAELADALRDNDVARIDRLKVDERALSRRVTECFTPNGHRKNLDKSDKKTLDRVSAAIKRIISKIRENDAPLGEHLEKYVNTGRQCSYSPHPTVDWSL